MPRGLIVLVALLSGCATTCPKPEPQIVEIPSPPQYVEIPSGLLIPCPVPDSNPRTNGELLEAFKARKQAMLECAARIEAIRKLQERAGTG